MKTLEMNEKNRGKSRGCTNKITHILLANSPRVLNLIKVMVSHNPLTLWLAMKKDLFEYSYILMKTLEMNKKSRKSQGVYLQNSSYLSCELP